MPAHIFTFSNRCAISEMNLKQRLFLGNFGTVERYFFRRPFYASPFCFVLRWISKNETGRFPAVVQRTLTVTAGKTPFVQGQSWRKNKRGGTDNP